MTPLHLDLIPVERRVLDLVRRHGALSRVRLSPRAGVTRSTLTRVASALLDLGLLREGERVKDGSKGVPEQLLELNPLGAITYGVSIDYYALRFMALDFGGKIVFEEQIHCAMDDPALAARYVQEIVNDHRSEARRYAHHLGLGVALPGAFASDGRRRLPVPGMERWSMLDLSEHFAAATTLPVYDDNDAHAAALAEWLFGCGTRLDSFAYIYLGQGIGGGIVESGRLRRGRHGNAAEFGMLYPRGTPRPSAADFMETLARAGPDADTHTASTLLAEEWTRRASEQLATLLDILIWTIDPGGVVLGGTLPLHIREALCARLRDTPLGSLQNGLARPLVVASTLDGSAALGAAALPFAQLQP